MRERPILFSGPMVRAILEGRKTQTRRVVRPQPEHGLVSGEVIRCHRTGREFPCPYGQPGDRLWVREKWAKLSDAHPECANDPGVKALADDGFFAADAASIEEANSWATRWRPSIHMPRERCRLTLEVVAVRVERLQAISEEDAVAEGVKPLAFYRELDARERISRTERLSGCKLPGPHAAQFLAGEWAKSLKGNPWVWVVEFKRVEAKA